MQSEITGVHCSVKLFQCRKISVPMQQKGESINIVENENTSEVQVGESCDAVSNTHLSRHDDVEYVCSENNEFNFMPLSDVEKRKLSQFIGIFCSFVDSSKDVPVEILNMEKPVGVKAIDKDGNCFFKVYVYSE